MAAFLFALALSSSCGAVTPSAAPLELADADAGSAPPDSFRAPDASAEDTSSSQALERDARGELEPDAGTTLPTSPCAGLINPPPTSIVPCSARCATCTSAVAVFVDCKLDGVHMCVAACSSCP